MATEFRLSYTGAEINQKLAKVDEIEIALENEYYTSTDIDTKINEVNTSIDEVNTSIETGLQAKADLVNGKIPVSQLPDDIGAGNDVDLSNYYNKNETDEALSIKADLVGGKVPLEQLPDNIGGGLTEVNWEDIIDRPEVTTEITENSQAIVTSGAIYELIGDVDDVISQINNLIGSDN